MKKYILGLLTLVSLSVSAQYVKVSTHYPSKETAQEIIKGRVKKFLKDEIDFTIEKRKDVFKTKYGVSKEYVASKLYRYFDKGDIEYISRTNGGYTFTIIVVDSDDDTEVLYYCEFNVDAFTQKIKEIEISKGY